MLFKMRKPADPRSALMDFLTSHSGQSAARVWAWDKTVDLSKQPGPSLDELIPASHMIIEMQVLPYDFPSYWYTFSIEAPHLSQVYIIHILYYNIV
jgi:hypothetical protein